MKVLAKRGFIVFALDRRIGGAAENVVPIEADVTDPESLQRALDSVRGVTTGFSHAGIYTLDSLVEIPDAGFERMFRVNVFGAFHVNKIFLPLLGDRSRIIMTTSELAPLDPLSFTGLYAVTKSALDKYAYSLRMELKLLGIKVSVIRAGAVRTSMLGVSTNSLDAFCLKTPFIQLIPKTHEYPSEAASVRGDTRGAEISARLIFKALPRTPFPSRAA